MYDNIAKLGTENILSVTMIDYLIKKNRDETKISLIL